MSFSVSLRRRIPHAPSQFLQTVVELGSPECCVHVYTFRGHSGPKHMYNELSLLNVVGPTKCLLEVDSCGTNETPLSSELPVPPQLP